MNSTENLEKILNYKFKNPVLSTTALTHSSYANERNVNSYERLEFLGDAVIELAVSNYIYENFNISSGELSKLRATLVSTENLDNISNNLKLSEFVLKSNSLPKISKKTNADLFESIVGAVYLDGGYDSAKILVDRFVIVDYANVEKHLANAVDPKTKLQEKLQKDGKAWEYNMINSYGLDHEKTFVVELSIDGVVVSTAEAKSLHGAENECAKIYLQSIN